MPTKKIASVLTMAATFLFGVRTDRLIADEPEPQLRAFILFAPNGAPEDFPDFEADGSRLLVTHGGEPAAHVPRTFFIGDDDSMPYVEEFFGTTWISNGYATHVTSAGAQTFRLFWQNELPPNGAVCPTGPDGLLLTDIYWLRIAAAGEGDTSDGDWVAEDIPTFNSRPFLHGVGLFSK